MRCFSVRLSQSSALLRVSAAGARGLRKRPSPCSPPSGKPQGSRIKAGRGQETRRPHGPLGNLFPFSPAGRGTSRRRLTRLHPAAPPPKRSGAGRREAVDILIAKAAASGRPVYSPSFQHKTVLYNKGVTFVNRVCVCVWVCAFVCACVYLFSTLGFACVCVCAFTNG